MIVLLDTSEALDVCATELGCEVEQLLSPLTGFVRQKQHANFAFDNGGFGGCPIDSYMRLLEREKEAKHLCRFATVPDIVGDARRTLEVFEHWKYKMSGWPLAFVAQNGQEDLPIPWKHIHALFIGGLDKGDGHGDWKLGQHAKACIRAAQAMGKYVHVGRVNTPGRFDYFKNLDVDSIDGTGLSRYTHMREDIWRSMNQPNLLTDLAPSAGDSFPHADHESPTAETASGITAETTNGSAGLCSTAQLEYLAGQDMSIHEESQ